RAEPGGRGLDGHSRHRCAAAKHLSAGRGADAGPGRRFHARLLADARPGSLPRRTRGALLGPRGPRGGAALRARLHAPVARTRRGVAAPASLEDTLERYEELVLANDHFEFFVFPHVRTALTRTNNRTDAPPRPRGRARAYADDVLLTNRAFELLCRAGRRFPR